MMSHKFYIRVFHNEFHPVYENDEEKQLEICTASFPTSGGVWCGYPYYKLSDDEKLEYYELVSNIEEEKHKQIMEFFKDKLGNYPAEEDGYVDSKSVFYCPFCRTEIWRENEHDIFECPNCKVTLQGV